MLGKILVLLVVAMPVALAFPCNDDECLAVQDSNLTEAEKDLLYSKLLYADPEVADHQLVEEWNTNIEFYNAPEGVKTYNGEFVKDVWLVLASVMPSVLEQQELLVPDNVKVQTAYNYRLEIPSNYYSSGYPYTSGGDCRREYFLKEHSAELTVLRNGISVGSSRLQPIIINSDSKVISELDINVVVDVKHYRWYSYCCRKYKGECIKKCHDCNYKNTETKTDSIKLKDSKQVAYYKNIPQTDFKVINQYLNTTEGFFKADNYSSVKLRFEDSYYKSNLYYYDLVFRYKPYYVQTIRAAGFETKDVRNLILDNNSFFVKNTDNCQITVRDHFRDYNQECNLSFNKADILVKTDRLSYYEGDTIKAEVFPKNRDVKLTYADTSVFINDKAEFKANHLFNKIIAKLDGISYTKIIHVKTRQGFGFLFDLLFFLLIVLVIYKFFERKWSIQNEAG